MLVLGPSLGTSRMIWDGQAAGFGEHFRLLQLRAARTRRGRGSIWALTRSANWARGCSRLLDEYGIETAAYCGISLGGMIGMWLAATRARPDRGAWPGLHLRLHAAGRQSGDPGRTGAFVRAWSRSLRHRSGGGLRRSSLSERRRSSTAYGNELRWTNPTGYAGCCLAIADHGPARRPGQDQGADAGDPREDGTRRRRRNTARLSPIGIAGARLLVVEDAAHLANVSSPEVVTAALLEHLRVTMLKR